MNEPRAYGGLAFVLCMLVVIAALAGRAVMTRRFTGPGRTALLIGAGVTLWSLFWIGRARGYW